MVDVNPVNKNTSVNVSSSGTVSQIKTTTPQNYYDGLSKQWAISEDKVQGLDYSSKYYAQQAKENSQEAISALENVETVTTNAINQITTTKNETVDSIYDISSQTQQEITELEETLKTDLENTKVNAIDEVVQNKTNALDEIENKRSNAVEQIETLSEETLSDIKDLGVETRANLHLSNLSEEGEKHFLGKSNITNCLTKIPQRIKHTLVDGTLTILAGSVAIFPYGTEDLTEQFPIGSTFLNDNLKVVDTCWDGFKFFVWAELQTGFPRRSTYNTLDIIYLDRNGSNLRTPTNTACSGSTADTTLGTYIFWYDTANNYVKFSTDNGATWNTNNSLPLVIAQGNSTTGYTSIQHTFNGMGYIGSTIWVDKGCEGLVPNGRNEDGSLKNIKFTTSKIITRTTDWNGDYLIGVGGSSTIGLAGNLYSYDDNLNINYSSPSNAWDLCVAGSVTLTNGAISNFNPKQVFHALDYNDKSEIMSWSIPDYSAGVSVTFPFTAPYDGVLQAKAGTNNAGNQAKIGSSIVFDANIANSYGQATLQKVLMSKGQTVTVTSGSYVGAVFYPLKGAK